MAVAPNRYRYLSSLADELHSQSRRVRDLIGDAHWYYDGHHKEYLLNAVLNRHMPYGMIVRRGFVVSPDDPDLRTKEQDLLIIDTLQEAPIFQQGDVAIVFPQSVVAAISVKTKLDGSTIMDAVDGLSTVRNVAAKCLASDRTIWCGAYFFEVGEQVEDKPTAAYNYIGNGLKAHQCTRPVLEEKSAPPLGPQMFCTAHTHAYRVTYELNHDNVPIATISGFHAGGIATALFLAHLLGHLAWWRGRVVSDISEFLDGVQLPVMDPAEIQVVLDTP